MAKSSKPMSVAKPMKPPQAGKKPMAIPSGKAMPMLAKAMKKGRGK